MLILGRWCSTPLKYRGSENILRHLNFKCLNFLASLNVLAIGWRGSQHEFFLLFEEGCKCNSYTMHYRVIQKNKSFMFGLFCFVCLFVCLFVGFFVLFLFFVFVFLFIFHRANFSFYSFM